MTSQYDEQLPLDMVLRRIPEAEITCRWTRKLATVCDGTLTLEQAFWKLHWPETTGQRFALRALHQKWLEPVGSVNGAQANGPLLRSFQKDLRAVLALAPDLNTEDVVSRASAMIRLEKDWLSSQDIVSYLLAVELLLTDEQRDALLPLLDAMKIKYASQVRC